MFQKWKLFTINFILSSLIILACPLSTPQSQQIVLTPDPALTHTINQADLEQTRQIVNHRLKDSAAPDWSRAAIKGETIIVTLPKTVEQGAIIDDLIQTHNLALIETGVEFPKLDPTHQVRISQTADPDQNIYQILLSSADFIQAKPISTSGNDFGLAVTLTPESATRLADFLANRHGVYLCLTQDRVIMGCPIINLTNDTQLEIRQGPIGFLVDDKTLIDLINAGTLPVPLVSANTGR